MTDEATAWLDRWTTVRRLPKTFLAAKAYATRKGRAGDIISERPVQRPEPRNRIGKPLLSWKEQIEFLNRAARVAPTAVPIEYKDENAQAAFEAVYHNRLHMLRIKEPKSLLK